MSSDPADVTIILPVYNGEATLRQTLVALDSSIAAMRETRPGTRVRRIVVDDGSTDASANVARRHGWDVLSLPRNRGLSAARNHGAACATGRILVFVDDDAIVPEDALERLASAYDDPETGAVTCLLDAAHPNEDFFSQYKNLYMHYNFATLDAEADFLYGTLHSVRRSEFVPFDTSLRLTADTQAGQTLRRRGVRVWLDHGLQVIHLKRHDARSFFVNDFQVPFEWGTRFFRNAGLRGTARARSYAHASARQLLSLVLAPLSLALFVVGVPSAGAAALAIFYAANLRFLRFLLAERGWTFLAGAIVVIGFDALVMSAGAACGVLRGALLPMPRAASLATGARE